MPSLQLIPEAGGEALVVGNDVVVVGRDPSCDIQLADASVSRRHAQIRQEGDRWLIQDLDSANGVLLDGRKISTDILLTGQQLQFGSIGFRVKIDLNPDTEGATVILTRPTPPRGQRAPLPATVMARPAAPRPTTPPSRTAAQRPHQPPKSGGSGGWVMVLGLIVLVGVGVAYWFQTNPTVLHKIFPPPALPASEAVAPTPADESSPEASDTQTKTPVPATAGQAIILVSTEVGATVFVDGQHKTNLRVGGIHRVEVRPGEHLVTFEVGKQRRTIVVKAAPGTQSVARLLTRDLETPKDTPRTRSTPQATPPPPIPRETPTPRVAPTPRPTATPRPPAPTPQLRAPTITDAGLAKGVAAVKRGDFYRAKLILIDATRRLDQDPAAREELAVAHAYLAWTYYGLNSQDEATGSASRAIFVFPDIAGLLEGFPPQVIGLFKR